MRLSRRLAAVLVLAAAPLMAAAQQLTVSAAASLTDAFREIGTRFEAVKPGTTVRFNFAASGVLIQQILQGAPVDVFVSADQETMDRGVKEKVLDAATRRDFTSNSLVMVTPMAGAPTLSRIADLTRPEVKRVAIGKLATVPVGRYTKQSLEAAKVWEAVEPKFVFADSVRQVLDYVARGEVEAGFVYRTDAELMKDKVRVVLTARDHAPVTYPAAVVTDSRQPALAREFVAFLSSAEAQSILGRYGFGKHD
ncbi:molybdate ABC transporter substrate-binding protein [uncultured Azohydromonas sp.]|jgi:molybdenum ABC transporter, periplasmic molybdate-binding protein|uniref:molybdate ABC transporter substrate-binding protein n=1 Tax=uncultured Azohydromonas sp. TaxID=487342 RepID=UPI00262ADD75|nr:molybdate ABC transporter substrate-binding protein [uncultured Azohydromonas sp.]